MLKMVLNAEKGKVCILGLSHMNLEKLREGMPIMFEAKELKLGPEWDKVIILAGETENKIATELMSEMDFGDPQ